MSSTGTVQYVDLRMVVHVGDTEPAKPELYRMVLIRHC